MKVIIIYLSHWYCFDADIVSIVTPWKKSKVLSISLNEVSIFHQFSQLFTALMHPYTNIREDSKRDLRNS